MFALPHSHYLNFSVWGVCTSLVVKDSKTQARLYGMKRDMLNRSLDTYTPLHGYFKCNPAYAWDWLAYMKKRDAFDIARGKVLEEKIQALHEQGLEPDKDQVFQIVSADPDRFKDAHGNVSQSQIEAELGVSQAKSNYAATKYRRQKRSLEQAEKNA